jgi:hypothetical protein
MCAFLASIRCINEYLSANSISGNNAAGAAEDSKTLAATYQYINNMTDYLTLTNKDFLTDFSQSFCNINNLENISSKFQYIFDMLDFNKKLAYLQNDYDNQMGKTIIFVQLVVFKT